MRAFHVNILAVAVGIILFFVVLFAHADPVVKCEPWSQTKCGCHQKEDPKTKKCKKDANTYGCPCLDVTNGHPTPGTCITPETTGPNPHCKGSGEKQKGEGKPPEMPKPPEPKPKEDKPKDQNQKPCNATSTPNVSGMVIGSGGTNVGPDGLPCTDKVSGGGGIANAFELPRSLSTQGLNSTCTFGTNTSQSCTRSIVGGSDALTALRALASQTDPKSLWQPEEVTRALDALRGLEGWMKTQSNSLSPIGGPVNPEAPSGAWQYFYGVNGEIYSIPPTGSPGTQNGQQGGQQNGQQNTNNTGGDSDPYIPQTFGNESTFGQPERTTSPDPQSFTHSLKEMINKLMHMLGMK